MAFAASLLLGALASIAIPIVLHLMARDVPKTVRFSTLRFLTKDKLETHSKKGIRDLLILIMRCLAIAGLVFAFSRPFLPLKEASISQLDEVVVLLDNSASMNREQLKKQVKEKILDLVSDEESISLVVSSNDIQSKSGFGSKSDLKLALDNLVYSLHEGHHEEAMRESIASFHKEAKSRKLIIVSDFQANDWNMKQVPELPTDIKIQLFNPFSEKRENVALYVDRIRRLNAGEITQAQVVLRNNTFEEINQKLTFSAGQKIVEENVALDSGEVKKLVLTMEAPDSSKAIIKIDAQDDFPSDNQVHLWLGDEAPITVAFPEGQEGDSLDYIFVKKALMDVKAGDASFRVQAVDSQILSIEDLESYQVLVLTDTAHDLQSDVYEGLAEYVNNGGLIIVAPALRAGMIFSRLKAYGLADVRFTKTVKRKSSIDLPFRFEEMSAKSSLLDIFDKTQDSDLQQFPIYTYNEFSVGGTGLNILEVKKGVPGISVFPKGRGNVIVSAIPFNHIWSDFTISNSFLPLLRQMIISKAATEENSILKLNIGEKKLVSGSFDEYVDTSKAGSFIYDETPIVVNISKQESSISQMNLIDFKARLKQSDGSRITVKNTEGKGIQYWHYFFMLAIIALLVEFLLADLKGGSKLIQ